MLGYYALRRSPYGERGLKWVYRIVRNPRQNRRSPYGERGLKSSPRSVCGMGNRSLSVWGAWIEIKGDDYLDGKRGVALRMGSVD